MFTRITQTALAAGLIAGVFLWAAHMILTTPLIQAAEVYESATPGPHAHATPGANEHAGQTKQAQTSSAEKLRRHGLTLLMDVLTAIGFAFLLTGAISLAGSAVDWRQGLIWGLCGFAAFFVAPSTVLPPNLPGMNVAPLEIRQIWWLATAATTATGLGLALLSGTTVLRVSGIILIALPHAVGALVGAPGAAIPPGSGGVPAELAARFVVATTVATGLFWLVLGAMDCYFYSRFDRDKDTV